MIGLQFSDADLERARTRWDVIAGDVPMKRVGRELAGCCPFHAEKTPSFTINADKGFFHCFGCGAHGTAIDYVMRVRGLEFVAAVRELLGMPQQAPKQAAPVARQLVEPEADRDRDDELRGILAGCGPITPTTAANLYLWSRGLRHPGQFELLAHPALYCHEVRAQLPALVAPITSSGGEITALQRIWLVSSFIADEARDSRAPLKARKKTLGIMADGAVRLRPGGRVLGIAEGVETAAAAIELFRWPVWAACGVSRLGFPPHWRELHTPQGERPTIWIAPNKPPRDAEVRQVPERPPAIWIPPDVERLVIYADNGMVGQAVADYAEWYWRRHRGIDAVAQCPSSEFGDFNDQLLSLGAAA